MRLAMCGWESGNADEFGPGYFSNGVESLVAGRSGNYGWQVNCDNTNSSLNGVAGYRIRTLPGTPAELWLRVAIKAYSNNNGNPTTAFLSFMDGADRQLCFAWVGGQAAPAFKVYRATTQIANGGSLSSTTWRVLEAHVIIHPSAGKVEVWLDGVQVTNFTGNTQTSASSRITDVRLGLERVVIGGFVNGCYENATFDDFAVNDTSGTANTGRIGQGGIFALRPTADIEKGWSPNTGSDNFAMVDDPAAPDDDTTYVTAIDSGMRDLYEYGNLSGGGQIDAVQVALRGKNVAGVGGLICPVLKSGAVINVGSPGVFVTSYTTFTGAIFETNPDGAVPWTLVAVNSLQAGMVAN